jgi:hypothetical protein
MAFNASYNYNSPKTIHDNDDGDSQIYVGIKYLGIVAQQINEMRMAAKMALANHEHLPLWLNELRVFYDLVENRTGLHLSKDEVELYEYKFNSKDNTMEQVKIKVQEKNKYEHWFSEIMLMLERNANVHTIGGTNPYMEKKYLNNKKIITELSNCQRELLRDANKRHLIMPEGVKDMKGQVRNEWLDREVKKEF